MSTILEFADKLRNQIDIVDVVGRYVELRRMGLNLKGLCPFHGEKTPSFTVSSNKQIFHCFGCHEGGDVIKFVQKIERLEWMEAVRHLSQEFSIPMPELRGRPEASQQIKDARADALTALRLASDFYCNHLLAQVKANAEIKDYLERRGLSAQIIEHFRIGLAPNSWSSLMESLNRAGHTKDTLMDAGLIIKHATKDSHYDRFRNRLIFPVHDKSGVPVAFGARVYASNASPDEPKYINSPESLVYHKGEALYALHHAKDSIQKANKAVLMEGYMDVVRAHECGITNAVASCGTALTEEQARNLKRLCSHVIFAYDGDAAGQKAMLKGSELLLHLGFSVSVLALPDNHDPDSYLREHGAADFQKMLDSARNFFEHFLNHCTKQYDITRPEGKVQTVELFLPLLQRVQQPILKTDYINRLADRLKVEAALIHRQMKDSNPNNFQKLKTSLEEVTSHQNGTVETTLLKVMVECPSTRQKIRAAVNSEWLRNPLVKKWFTVCDEATHDELTWSYLLETAQSESDRDVAFLRSLAVDEDQCDRSDRTITNVAERLRKNHSIERNKIIAMEVDEFYHSDLSHETLIENVQQSLNSRNDRGRPTGEYFLKTSRQKSS